MHSGASTRPIDFSQVNLLAKMAVYLQARYPNPTPEQTRMINQIKNPGHCSGFMVATLAALQLKTQPMQPIDYLVPREDIDWVVKMETLLDQWDGDFNHIDPENIEDIDRFIKLINRYQNIQDYETGIGTGNLDLMLDNNGEHPKREYSIAGCFDSQEISQKFNLDVNGTTHETSLIEAIAQPGRMVVVTSEGHDTGIFYWNDLYFYYDANIKTGIQAYTKNKLDTLVEQIFHSNFYSPDNPSKLGFRVFSFTNEPVTYPDVKSIHEMFAAQLPATSDDKSIMSLTMASSIGCKESFEYFLRQYQSKVKDDRVKDPGFIQVLRNAAAHNNFELLHQFKFLRKGLHSIEDDDSVIKFAARYGYCGLLRDLVKLGVNVNTRTIYDETPLIVAAHHNHLSVVQTLLELGANPNIAHNPKKNTPLHIAARNNNYEMVEALLKAGATINAANAEEEIPAKLTTDERIISLLAREGLRRKFDRSDTKRKFHSMSFTTFAPLSPDAAKSIRTIAETVNMKMTGKSS